MYLLRQDKGRQVSPFGQAEQQMQLMEPDTSEVVGAFVNEAWSGIGTLSADLAASDVRKAETIGTPLTKEQYQASPNYRANIPYYRGMTEESARQLSVYNDEREKNAEFINDATSGQYALGITAAFTAGVLEPKNIATGLVTSLALTPVAGAVGPAAGSIRRLMKLRQMSGQWGGKIALGAIEGGVSAAIAEPSNQHSASILKQDYTMADSMWNIALSTAFGVTASTAGIGAKEVPKFLRSKWEAHGARTPDIIASEMDTAVSQLATGKKVDISPIEGAIVGDIARKPVADQARIAESFVRYTETPEFKARFEGSKIVDEQGQPLRVYHGTKDKIDNFQMNHENRADHGWLGDGIYLTDSPHLANIYAINKSGEDGSNIMPLYANIKNPYILNRIDTSRWKALLKHDPERAKSFSDSLKRDGYDGIIAQVASDAKEVVVFSPDQIISAFGADDLPAITKRLDAENAAKLQRAAISDLDPNNDTAIDQRAINDINIAEIEPKRSSEQAASEAEFFNHMEEISAMKREGQLTAEDEKALLNALNSVDEETLNTAYDDLYACLTRG